MGGNVSTSRQRALSVIQSASKASCQNKTDVSQKISGIRVELVGANCGAIKIANEAKALSTCNLSQMSTALAEASMGMDKEQVAMSGGGFNSDSTVQERASIIQQKLEAACGNDTKVKQEVSDVGVRLIPYYEPATGETIPASCDALDILNQADLTSQCVAKQVLQALDRVAQGVRAKQVQKTNWGAIIAIVVVFIVLAIIAYFVLRGFIAAKAPPPQPAAGGGRRTAVRDWIALAAAFLAWYSTRAP